MSQSVIIDVFCIAIMLTLLLSMPFQNNRSKTSNRFSILLLVAITYFTCDLISSIIEGKPKLTTFSYIINYLCFVSVDCLIIAFSTYLATLMGTIKKKWQWVLNPGVFFTYIRFILITVLTLKGDLFVIDSKGYYVEKPHVAIPYYLSGAIMIMLVLIVVRNKKYFTPKQMLGMLAYLILPVPAVIAEMITGIYFLTTASIALSILLVYIMIQSSIIENGKIRESILEEISSTDLLTGLNNRRAYYNFITKLRARQNVGVIYCDINNLKYTNDNFGHTEGDKLIVRFSTLLSDYFESVNVYRISGDEFVVVLSNISESDFDESVCDLIKIIAENNSIAAYGYSYGIGCDIEQIITDAENNMYETKRYQYENNLVSTASRENLEF